MERVPEATPPPHGLHLLLGLGLVLSGVGCTVISDDALGYRLGDSGADGGGLDGGGLDGGSDGGLELLNLTGLEPADGPTTGGTELELLGGPFDDSIRVDIGETPATVLNVQDAVVRIRTPVAPDGPATVDVVATTATAQGTLPDAFTWWEGATGKASMLGTWMQLEVQGELGPAPSFEAWFRFVDPIDAAPWQRYGIAMGECGPPKSGFSSYQGPAEVDLGFESERLALTWDAAREEYRYLAAGTPKLRADAALGIEIDASTRSPAISLDDIVDTPLPLQLLAPALGDTPPELEVDEVELSWEDPGTDHIMIAVGTDRDPLFLCMVNDRDGTLLDPHLFDGADWHSRGGGVESLTIWLAVAAVASGQVHLDHDDGELRLDAGTGVIGQVVLVRKKE